jgi:inorganic pyrophosphatase
MIRDPGKAEVEMAGDDFPDIVDVVVEISKGSRNKYEYDHASGRIKLNRVLSSSVHYPADYGFILGTEAEDGDEVDVLVLIEEPTFPGCLIEAKPIGYLEMHDEKGGDNKIIAVPLNDPRWGNVRDLYELPSSLLDEIENFFLTYKRLESKVVKSGGWHNSRKALDYLKKSRK